jgi:tryptophan 2,3-dioxygenase
MISVTYPAYLQLDRILSAQQPMVGGRTDDNSSVFAAEHFFIVTHQAFELWFRQVLIDLECAEQAMADDPERALDHLQRVAAVFRLLVQQMVLFDRLPPNLFLAFRPLLGSASGSESEQWRHVQRVLGLRGGTRSPIYHALVAVAAAHDMDMLAVYRDPSRAGVLYRLAEVLLDISDLFWQMTAAHVQVAERTIGGREGTGGTSGVEYLKEGLKVRAFPELVEIRTRL